MKTKALIIICSLSMCLTVYSQNSDNSATKIYTTYAIENIQKRTKVVYKYNREGQRTERTLYTRYNTTVWIPIQMHTYQYNNQGKIADIIYTKWSQDSNCWEEISDHLIHIYDKSGKLLSVEKSKSRINSNLAHK